MKTIRAVTSEELKKLVGIHNDCHLLIIEGIYQDEVDETGEVINNFKSTNNNNVVIFFSASDPVTRGLADSLNYDIYTDLGELYNKVKKTTGINASIFLKDKKEQVNSIDNNDIFGTPETTNDAEEMKNDIANAISQVESDDIKTSETNEIVNGADISDIFGSSGSIEDDLTVKVESKDDKVASESSNEQTEYYTPDYSSIEDDINFDELKDSSEVVNKLITALADSKLKNNELRKDTKRLSERNAELEELVVTLTDQKDSLVEEYYSIVSSDEVFEDPITLSEYQTLQEAIAEHTTTNMQLKGQIAELKNKLAKREDTILGNLAEIGALGYQVDSLTNELDALKIKIESGEIHTDIIAEYEEKLGNISLTNERIADLYKEAMDQNRIDGELISILRQNLDIEVALRYKTTEMLKGIFKQILKDKQAAEKTKLSEKELQEKYDKLVEASDELKDKLSESDSTGETLQGDIAKLNETIENLNKKIAELNSKVDDISAEKTKVENELEELKKTNATLDTDRAAAESLNDDLVEENEQLKTSSDELKAANEGLTGHITNLTNQLTGLRNEKTDLEKSKTELEGKVNKLEKDIEVLKPTISELSKVRDTLKQREATIKNLEEKITKLNTYLSEKDMLIKEKDSEIKRLTIEISTKDAAISSKDKEIGDIKLSLKQSNDSLESLRKKLNESTGSNSAKDTQLQDLNNEINTLKKNLEAKQKEVDAGLKSNSALNAEIDKLKAQIEDLNEKISQFEAAEKESTAKLTRAANELKTARKELSDEKAAHTATKDELETANVTIGVQKTQLESAKKALEAKIGEVSESKSDYNDLKEELSDSQIKLSTAENLIKTNEIKYKNALTAKDNEHKKQIESINATIADKDTLIDTLTAQLKKANSEKAAAMLSLKAKDGEISKLTSELETKTDEVAASEKRLTEERERFKKSLDTIQAGAINIDLNGDGTISQDELNEANRKIRQLEHDLALERNNNGTLESELDKLRNSSGDLKKIKTLTEALEKMTAQNNELTETNTQLEADNATANASVSRMKTEISGLKSMLLSAQQRSTGESFEIKPIKYKGTAKIVSVFGSGSHGVTTAAMSVASKLSGSTRVVYLDFNLVAPSADSWLRTSPIIKKYNMTAFNIFVEKGVDIIEENIKDIILKIDKTKGGGFDYFSGLYDIAHKFGEEAVANADFSGLLNMLSRHYDYIVVDLGTLGASSLVDSMICQISSTTKCNIAVTTSDQFEIRNFGNKLEGLSFTNTSVSWLINMCPTGNWQGVPQKIMDKYINKYKYAFLYDDPSIRGAREKFGNGNNRQNRETFDFFMMNSVFGD